MAQSWLQHTLRGNISIGASTASLDSLNGLNVHDELWELPGLACSTQVFEHAVSSGMRKAANMDVVVSPPCVAVVSRLS